MGKIEKDLFTRDDVYNMHYELFLVFLEKITKEYEAKNITGIYIRVQEFAKWLDALECELKCFPPE